MSAKRWQCGHTIRSVCGRARVTYRPDWQPAIPWITYADGSALRSFGEPIYALRYLQDRGFRFPKDWNPGASA